MTRSFRSLALAAPVALAAWGAVAAAQDSNTVGVPQLKDFQLKGERRTPETVPAPTPAPAPAPTPTPPAAPGAERRPPQPRAVERQAPPAERRGAQPTGGAEQPRRAAPALPAQPQDLFTLPGSPAPEGAAPAPAPVPMPQPAAGERPASYWIYLLPAALAALIGFVALRRRRRSAAIAQASAEARAAAGPPPRADPVPRPWLELELTANRAAATENEAWVEFALVIRNTGKSSARNIRINARMFNAGREQDKEIGTFFKTRGEGRRTHAIPELPPGAQGLIEGTVSMPREEMRALKIDQQLLFIPVVGVNTVYDWGEGRTGQTSKSYLIGRELGEEKDKMGGFRVDLGPRIYRNVGQRPTRLAKRV